MTVTLRLILGDQLSPGLSSLRGIDHERDTVLMAEVESEATYVRHHRKKLAFVFSAMRHFAAELEKEGVELRYVRLQDPKNGGSLAAEVERAFKDLDVQKLVVTAPGEWRLLKEIKSWHQKFGIPVEIREDARFLCSRSDFARWAEGRKELRMEHFYRWMRRQHGLLMESDGKPAGGSWNFDKENRKALPADIELPRPMRFSPDKTTKGVLDLVDERFPDNFGDLEPFWFAVTASDAKRAFAHFLKTGLPCFGDYQDAMRKGEAFLFHATTALYLNIGFLDPIDLCRRAEKAWRNGKAPLNAVEGFIRQVIGWREFVRGIYWLKMPGYARSNFFAARRKLPPFYWSGKTDMACLADAIATTRREAYAHHIQRLMVTGNFALLAGLDPSEVEDWYLSVYADAYEWVELPNTHGMALFADGGVFASKPYAASGKYIDRMSNYCKSCRYDVRKSGDPDGCPFNALYWNFLAKHRDKLEGNPRMALVYKSLDRMNESRVSDLRKSAENFLATLKEV